MKTFRTLVPAVLVCGMMAASGCSNESKPGGPGATTKPTPKGETQVVADNPDQTFTVKVPATETNIDQGKDDEVTLTIDRGKDFKQAVKVAFEAPQGVTITPPSGEFAAGSTEMKVRVAAAATAPVGKADVKVTGTPETGKPVMTTFPVEIKEVKPGT
jgi:hypothetical protein